MLDPVLIGAIVIGILYAMIRMRRATRAQRGRGIAIAVLVAAGVRAVLVVMEAMIPWQTIIPDMVYVAPNALGAMLSYWDASRGEYGEQVYPLVWGNGGVAGNWGRSAAINQANTIINLVIVLIGAVVLRGLLRREKAGASTNSESE